MSEFRKIRNGIRKELRANADKEYQKSIERFFKDDQQINFIGVRTPIVRKISRKYFLQIKSKTKNEILKLCQELLKNGYSEEQGIAFGWASQVSKNYERSDFVTFKVWLGKYVKNWGHCDGYCSGVLGPFVRMFPEFLSDVEKWTKSNNRWFRRASAVLMITLIKEREYLKDAFKIADLLIEDKDDLVQKGYGWLLKEASNYYQKEVFRYVMKRKVKMPRTALRYAIEKMPAEMRQKAMER